MDISKMTTANIAGQPREWSYDELCQTCRDAVEAMDNYRFLIGDTALEIETRYGEHNFDDFVRDIGQNNSTVKGWRRVSKAYSKEFRAELFEEMPNLTYTYLRDTLRLGNDPEILRSWLRHVTDNNFTADEAARKLTENLGHKTIESYEGTITRTYTQDDGRYFVVKADIDLRMGQVISIRLK